MPLPRSDEYNDTAITTGEHMDDDIDDKSNGHNADDTRLQRSSIQEAITPAFTTSPSTVIANSGKVAAASVVVLALECTAFGPQKRNRQREERFTSQPIVVYGVAVVCCT